MNFNKLHAISQLLSKYHFDFNENIPNNLKCTKCQNIIINAKQIPCGCKFCSKCLEKLIENGSEYCPGITDLCKEASLSDSIIDYSVNRDISNIVVKCPYLCSHEDKLINMDGHLRICTKKSTKCVFNNLGCCDLVTEDIEVHLQSDCYMHMKMLVDTIDDMRKENENVKNEVENMRKENEKSKKQIENMKKENENRKKECEQIRRENENRKKENENMRKENENRKNENKALKNQIEEMDIENQVKLETLSQEIQLIHEDGKLVKTIDRLDERKKNKECIRTKCFYGICDPYKMSLWIYLNGQDGKGTYLSIRFIIWDDVRNYTFKWPFIENVTVNIRNKNALRSQTKKVEIENPGKDLCGYGPNFNFEYSDLSSANLLFDNFMIVECIVDE